MSEGPVLVSTPGIFVRSVMAAEISRRLSSSSCATVTAGGGVRQGGEAGSATAFRDHLLFHEYFDGDDAQASAPKPQTGWTDWSRTLQQSGD